MLAKILRIFAHNFVALTNKNRSLTATLSPFRQNKRTLTLYQNERPSGYLAAEDDTK